jgi:hypothetical protein
MSTWCPGDLFDMLLPMLSIYQEYVRNHHYSLQVTDSIPHSKIVFLSSILSMLQNLFIMFYRSSQSASRIHSKNAFFIYILLCENFHWKIAGSIFTYTVLFASKWKNKAGFFYIYFSFRWLYFASSIYLFSNLFMQVFGTWWACCHFFLHFIWIYISNLIFLTLLHIICYTWDSSCSLRVNFKESKNSTLLRVYDLQTKEL